METQETLEVKTPLMDRHNESNKGYVRLATIEDACALQAIYAHYVNTTVVSLEYVAPDVAEFERRMKSFMPVCPYLVYCEGESILGYAYAHPAFERAAYAWNAETTVYLAPDARGRGIGRALYKALVEMLTLQGYKILLAIIVAENKESCAFHERQGYRLAALFKNAGYKFNRWLDVAWYKRELGTFDSNTNAPIPFKQLPKETILRICRDATDSL